ncbi:hypothetical protein [Parabacteroides sp.]
MRNIIERPYYMDKFRPYIGQPIIKVLTGQRRIGKSYILLQLIEKIKHEDLNANIIAINKEDDISSSPSTACPSVSFLISTDWKTITRAYKNTCVLAECLI